MPSHPDRYSLSRLEEEAEVALQIFREGRATEPLELYLELYEEVRSNVEDTMEATIDLTAVADDPVRLVSNDRYLDVVRYLAGPPISKDDLRNLAGNDVFWEAVRGEANSAHRLRPRFVWSAIRIRARF